MVKLLDIYGKIRFFLKLISITVIIRSPKILKFFLISQNVYCNIFYYADSHLPSK